MVDYDKMVADARDELFACVEKRRFCSEDIELVHSAYALAEEAHRPQRRKSGEPYILHPIAVAMIVANEIGLGVEPICAALLHDVVEDTAITFEDLEKQGFNNEIINALKLLTHDKNTPYMEYVGEIKKNAIATVVKLADLRHNSDLSRLSVIDEKALVRGEKYKKAIELLS